MPSMQNTCPLTPPGTSPTKCTPILRTAALLSDENWNTLAEAARWSRGNASVLVDTHWIGGDPAGLEVYGWAAWSPQKGIVTLRNPRDRAQFFDLDVGAALELPDAGKQQFSGHAVWNSHAETLAFQAGAPRTIRLEPFEVATLELTPGRI